MITIKRAISVGRFSRPERVLVSSADSGWSLVFYRGAGWCHIPKGRLVLLPGTVTKPEGLTWCYGYEHPNDAAKAAMRKHGELLVAQGLGMRPMYEVLKVELVKRGWAIDPEAKENQSGEVHEFVHPKRGEKRRQGKKMAFIDALLAQMDLENYP